MAITFPNNVLLVDGVQVRLYNNIDSRILESGVTPYIKNNNMPKISWVAQGVENQGPLVFKVEIRWIGNGTTIQEKEIDESGIYGYSYSVPSHKKLKHTRSSDAGMPYEVIITVSQDGSPDVRIGGQFRINFKPFPPSNLTIS